MALLEARNLKVAYGEVVALHNVSLEIAEGELVAILGANGSGKTTLLKTLSGLLRPIEGELTLDGKSLIGSPVHSIVRQGISHVPEGRGLLPELTVRENLQLGMYTCGRSVGQSELPRIFSLFPVLAQRLDQTAGMLSGGEQQMLAIARSLVGRPRLLMVDELSLGLAPKIAGELIRLLAGIHKQGTTVLIVEQNVRQALKYASRVYVLANGRSVYSGPASDLLDKSELLDAYFGKD